MKFPHLLTFFIGAILIVGCQNHPKQTLSQPANNLYQLPRNWTAEVLFDEADSVIVNDSLFFLTKGSHDLIEYIPINKSSTHGFLFVSHETIVLDSVYGDGGGATIFEIKKEGINWKVISEKSAIDFSNVNQTVVNCGGKLSPNGTILMAEEMAPETNNDLKGLDTNKYSPTDFGWIVEVNHTTKKATRKLRSLGRYKHEDVFIMPDNKIIYVTNDDTPAVLFKFICKSVGDYNNGQLYAYNQTDSIHWKALPMDKFSLENAKDIAITKGATMFVRHEWLTVTNNKLYITETGNDYINWKKHILNGGTPASYFNINKDSSSADPYGRVLCLDLDNDSLSVFKEGTPTFSNPDCLTNITIDSIEYLLVAEDIIGKDNGRSSDANWGNELWLFNIKTKASRKIMQAPKGSEITGLKVTPNQKTIFLNIQHPDNSISTLNGSTTLAIQVNEEK